MLFKGTIIIIIIIIINSVEIIVTRLPRITLQRHFTELISNVGKNKTKRSAAG